MTRLVGFLALVTVVFSSVSCSGVRTLTSGLGGSESDRGSDSTRGSSFSNRRTMSNVRTTAYSDKENEMGGIYKNLSASGRPLRYGRLRSAAADWSHMPMGTLFRIKGLPYIYEVDDYGSALVGTKTVDLYKPSLAKMNAWGTRQVDIEVIREGSYAKSLDIMEDRLKAAHVRQMVSTIKKKKRL